jgi:hypothetical protein
VNRAGAWSSAAARLALASLVAAGCSAPAALESRGPSPEPGSSLAASPDAGDQAGNSSATGTANPGITGSAVSVSVAPDATAGCPER